MVNVNEACAAGYDPTKESRNLEATEKEFRERKDLSAEMMNWLRDFRRGGLLSYLEDIEGASLFMGTELAKLRGIADSATQKQVGAMYGHVIANEIGSLDKNDSEYWEKIGDIYKSAKEDVERQYPHGKEEYEKEIEALRNTKKTSRFEAIVDRLRNKI